MRLNLGLIESISLTKEPPVWFSTGEEGNM